MAQKTIGRYEIRGELGRGGMGAVYLAYDPNLEREVALKLLPSYFAQDPEFSSRFAREAKTVAGLDHQAIVAVYDFGEDDVWPYFVMRYMRGGSLKDRLARGSVNLNEANHIIQRVAGALDKAHSNGVVHRDLKPGNILYDDEGQPYLGDFGIVRLAESSENFTRTGNALGTPAYMSPEQADALPDVDGRSDVYALGVVLYEMLAGKTPYQHDSMPRLLIMHLTSPIPNLIEARPDLPAALQEVINKAMAKDRTQRYQSAGDMAAALQAVTHAAARPASPPKPAAAPAAQSPQSAPAAAPKPAVAQQPAPTPAAQPAARQTVAPKPTAPRPATPSPQPAAAQRPTPQPAAAGSPPAQQPPAQQPPAQQPPAQQPPAQQPPAQQPTAPQATPAPLLAAIQPAPGQPAAAPAKSGSGRKWIFALVSVVALAVIGVAVVAVVLGSGVLSGSGSSDLIVNDHEDVDEPIAEPAGSGAGDISPTLQRIVERGQIRFGVTDFDAPPLLVSPGEQASGFEADLFAAVSERLTGEPLEVVYALTDSGARRLETISDGSAEVSTWANVTSDLNEFGTMAAGNIYFDGQRVMVHAESGVVDWPELNGASICLVDNGVSEPEFDGFARAIGIEYEPLLLGDYSQAMQAFEEGRCDGFVFYWIGFLILENGKPQHPIVGELHDGSIVPISLVVSAADPEFRDEVNAALDKVIADGTYETIFQRWFGQNMPFAVDQLITASPR